MTNAFKFCPQCATALDMVMQLEDGGEKGRVAGGQMAEQGEAMGGRKQGPARRSSAG